LRVDGVFWPLTTWRELCLEQAGATGLDLASASASRDETM